MLLKGCPAKGGLFCLARTMVNIGGVIFCRFNARRLVWYTVVEKSSWY